MKFLKTSWTQWQPDHLAAGPLFDQSADAYQKAGELNTSYLMYVKAMESHELASMLGAAAITATKASGVAKAQGDVENTAKMLIVAAEFWGNNGDLAKYGEVLAKAAVEYEAVDRKEAIVVYQRSIDTVFPESTPKNQYTSLHPTLLDTMRKYFTLLIKENMLEKALALATRMISVFEAFDLEASLCKTMVAVSILHLSIGDVVQAQNVYLQEHLSNAQYIRSKECELADMLIMGATLFCCFLLLPPCCCSCSSSSFFFFLLLFYPICLFYLTFHILLSPPPPPSPFLLPSISYKSPLSSL